MENAVQRGMDHRSWKGSVEILGMDKKSFLRGQSYISLLYELTHKFLRILEVMDGRDTEAAEMLWETMPDEGLASINLNPAVETKRPATITPLPGVASRYFRVLAG